MSFQGNIPLTPEQIICRLEERVYKDPNSGCWIYLGQINAKGYPLCSFVNFKTKTAYRLVYELCKGKIPAGLEIDHVCRVRSCINPNHLDAVTHAENMRRSIGYNIGHHVLTVCRKGHPYTPENEIIRRHWKTGAIYHNCRICTNEAQRKNALKRKMRTNGQV